MRKDFIKNVCACCRTFSEEVSTTRSRKRSSSKRSRSRSKKERKSSRKNGDLASSKSSLYEISSKKPSGRASKSSLGKKKKTSFAQAVIRDSADKENIPENILKSPSNHDLAQGNISNLPKGEVLLSEKSSARFSTLHELVNKKCRNPQEDGSDSFNQEKVELREEFEGFKKIQILDKEDIKVRIRW